MSAKSSEPGIWGVGRSFERMEEFIKQSLNVYNYEKTGMTDFASELMGGCILYTKCTEDFDGNSRWFTFFGIRLSKIRVSARVVIQVRLFQFCDPILKIINIKLFRAHRGFDN
jgi:hypothetical protein